MILCRRDPDTCQGVIARIHSGNSLAAMVMNYCYIAGFKGLF